MTIGIVGSEAKKFTPVTEEKARAAIRHLIQTADLVVSGGCHLGGIDIWTIEEAKKLGKPTKEYLPLRRTWEGGYKQRNLLIARASDLVACITVEELPAGYDGMRFKGCYHCPADAPKHVKSGGCWTMKQAQKLGKKTALVVIR